MKRAKRKRATRTRTAAKSTQASRSTKTKPLTDAEVVELARKAVPARLHARAVVHRSPGRAVARAGKRQGEDTAAQVARLVGAKLPPPDEETVVEFVEETPLGKRHTVVHVRRGAITRVVTRAKR